MDSFLPADESAVTLEMPRWASQPLEQVLDEELKGVIRQSLMDLPEKYRLVVVLRDLEGFSTQETAEILNLTVVYFIEGHEKSLLTMYSKKINL